MTGNIVKKITLSGLLIALVIIVTRLFSIQNIPVAPFVRISLGPALIIFSSIYLGPIYGLVVGACSDIFGILIFQNVLGYGINPLFTLVYGLLGLLPYFIFKAFKNIKNSKINFCIFCSILAALFLFVIVYLFTNNSITLSGKTYTLLLWQKFTIIGVLLVLSILIIIALFYTNRLFMKKYQQDNLATYPIGISALICEVLIMLILNSIFKSFFFSIDLLFILAVQAVVLFIDVPLNTFITTYLLFVIGKIQK